MSIEEAVNEAVAIARGEQPAARMYINGHFYVPQADIAALTARVKEQDQIIALMQAACLPSEEEVRHAEAWLAANPNAPHSDYVPLAKETDIARLKIENIQMQAALGYGILAEDERHIIPSNPYSCGTCGPKADEITRLTARVKELEGVLQAVRFNLLQAGYQHNSIMIEGIDAALTQPAPEKEDTGITWWDDPDTYGAS
jgi:hypothetical protein